MSVKGGVCACSGGAATSTPARASCSPGREQVELVLGQARRLRSFQRLSRAFAVAAGDAREQLCPARDHRQRVVVCKLTGDLGRLAVASLCKQRLAERHARPAGMRLAREHRPELKLSGGRGALTRTGRCQA